MPAGGTCAHVPRRAQGSAALLIRACAAPQTRQAGEGCFWEVGTVCAVLKIWQISRMAAQAPLGIWFAFGDA